MSQSQKPEKRLYSLNEAGEALGISPWSLRRHIAEGRISPTRVGRRVLLSNETLDKIARQGLPPLTVEARHEPGQAP